MKKTCARKKTTRGTDEKIKMRVQIENVQPKINGGRFPVKRIIGDTVSIEADIFVDGHNELAAEILYAQEGKPWKHLPMAHTANDRWTGSFTVTELGRWKYSIRAWVDHFASWQRDFKKRVDAHQDVSIDLIIGAKLIAKTAAIADSRDAHALGLIMKAMTDKKHAAKALKAALSSELRVVMARYPDKSNSALYKELFVVVDPIIARYSSWYELFPRSYSATPGKHGTLTDVIAHLPYVKKMGFTVVYLPPIHPIGIQFRKGKNNSVMCAHDDVGSPWAIGSAQGGHCAIHPQLGTLKDFRMLVQAVKKHGLSLALDLAYQCSPDHPYVKGHPQWFRKRPDNTIQYAENPPKKYQDIYPIDFETPDWMNLWNELRAVVLFWIKNGIRIFRVDNPHTKDFSFWEWMINSIKKQYPDVIFLAEAFTRPKLLHRLAKLGFSQSYNYFAWRNTKEELTQYFTELTKTEAAQFLRPMLWPNTPDILTEYLQLGGIPAFKIRLILASTLGASYGIYGPAFELCENTPAAEHSEEYLNSEKYEIKAWNLHAPHTLQPLITAINRIRKEHTALQQDHNLEFFPIQNDFLICYGKYSGAHAELILVVVNLDPRWEQSGWLELPLQKLGIPDAQTFQVHDLLDNTTYAWSGPKNFIKLNPAATPAHIFKIHAHCRAQSNID